MSCPSVCAKYDQPVTDHGDHGQQRCECDQPETVNEGISPLDDRSEPDPERRNQWDGDRGSGHATRIIRYADNLFRSEDGHNHHQNVTADYEEVYRPPLQDAKNANQDGDTDGKGDRQTQPHCITAHGVFVCCDQSAFCRNAGRLLGYGYQSRFGNCCGKAESKRERQKPEKAAFSGQRVGHLLSDGKQAHLKALNEKGQTKNDQHPSFKNAKDVGQGLLKNRPLKKGDNQYDGQQILYCRQKPHAHCLCKRFDQHE
eukprot:TRINITY_DN16314_c0_g1_i1.p2 TRINITY_DN16314_c0_g1~~TRINITY_DN16314_c0_g1_i1.p2  ORF type:complete len:257 (+),score=26.43 TRINITY_DN16314_c0_g1_i1:339-1109(+)